MGCSIGSVFVRVMHMSFGMPLISAEHEPHLPALQFHRTAMSFARLLGEREHASTEPVEGLVLAAQLTEDSVLRRYKARQLRVHSWPPSLGLAARSLDVRSGTRLGVRWCAAHR